MMKLTGKCKEEFEEWLLKWLKENVAWECETPQQEDVDHFYKFPDSMQWGVLVDYFDSVEDKTENRILGKVSKGWEYYFFELKGNLHRYKTREEARTAAIEKADKIRNNILNELATAGRSF